MLELPKNNEIVSATSVDPKVLVLISFPKTGKTESALKLPNSILVDLEDSATSYSGTKINLNSVAKKEKVSKLRALKMIADALKADPRDYVILDTVTEIQDLAREYATMLYKQTLQGKGFTGKDVISELPQGAGWAFARNAMDDMLSWFDGTYNKGIIYLGHVKLASINKEGKDIQVKDLEIAGKSKQLLCKNADAIGIIYRGKNNQNIISFKSGEDHVVVGARAPHLSNEEFVFSEKIGTQLKVNWDKIYTDLIKENANSKE